MRRNPLTLATLVASAAIALTILGTAPRQGVPLPLIYSGNVTVQGEAASGGLSLVACVDGCELPGYKSAPVTTRADGSYKGLVVGPPNEKFLRKRITFWIVTEFEPIQASETPVYKVPSTPAGLTPTLDLTFTDPVPLPPPPAPIPPPLPVPVLPIPGDPAVTRIPALAVVAGIAALTLGASMLFLVGRRRAL